MKRFLLFLILPLIIATGVFAAGGSSLTLWKKTDSTTISPSQSAVTTLKIAEICDENDTNCADISSGIGGLSNVVEDLTPQLGADLDAQSKNITAINTLVHDTISAPVHSAGTLFYDTDDDELSFYNSEPDVKLNIGSEMWVKSRNDSGATIADFVPVFQTGALGNRVTIGKAKADSAATSDVIGITTHSIENNTDGFVTSSGTINGVDTDGSPFGETWEHGDEIFLSATVAGGLTNVVPTGNSITLSLGFVLTAANNGSFHVKINGANVVGISSSTDNTILRFDGTSGKRIQGSGIGIDDSDNITGANSVTTPFVIGGTGTTSDLNLQTTSGVGAAGADMHFLVGNNGATEAMTILNDGKVGIGRTDPTSQLTVLDQIGVVTGGGSVNITLTASNGMVKATSLTNSTIALNIQNAGWFTGTPTLLTLANSTQTGTSGQFNAVAITPTYNETSGTAANTDLLINRTETAIGSGSQFLFDAQVGGTSRFVVTSAGNVGIGTTTPNVELEVVGIPGSSVGGFASGAFHVRSPLTAINSNSVITGHSSFAGNTQLWYLGSVSSSNNDIAFINRQNAKISFNTGSANRITIEAGGNVGIGTGSPNQTLTIEGTMDMKEQAAAGADVASYGQLWVRNLTPNVKMFTDDAGTDFNISKPDKSVGLSLVASDTAVATGNGTQSTTMPLLVDGYNVIDALCSVNTKGITGATDVQLRRRRGGVEVDVFSTKITIGDEFFASDEVINTANDDVQDGDEFYWDTDAVHSGTAPNGLSCVMTLRLP